MALGRIKIQTMASRHDRVKMRRPWRTTATTVLTAAHHGSSCPVGLDSFCSLSSGSGLQAHSGERSSRRGSASLRNVTTRGGTPSSRPASGRPSRRRDFHPQVFPLTTRSLYLGRSLRPFDHPRNSSWSPALGPGRARRWAVVAGVGPTPFLVAETGGPHESGVVESRRILIQNMATTSSSCRSPIRNLRAGARMGFQRHTAIGGACPHLGPRMNGAVPWLNQIR